MSLTRTGNIANGKKNSEGMSAKDIEAYEQAQKGAQRVPHTDFDNWERLSTGQANIGERWSSDRARTLDTPDTLSEYKASKTNELLDRMIRKGGISRRRRRPSRKYKKSKRVFRKKSRSMRRR
jgi:hypothetical protein